MNIRKINIGTIVLSIKWYHSIIPNCRTEHYHWL